ncbi:MULTISPECIES: thiazole synthase [unclassified Prochlorococcus]|uniref:thiazole synthase n=1 Tax=unclassified Prochlorococcus TaxID=2627481 RepID=UPI0005336F30|nr:MULTISPECIES: thiazole synthase [unclassified Prochlorococcus]KGG14560.1 Thiazole biosynthesis protein ThiG [Prochlorococcus sp. MIT 0602]KGG16015.1 Thiazole biosynthesis protein ThiG [Prochlorococcus sp. MIT 0603]
MNNNSSLLNIGNKSFQSRLLIGTGKYNNLKQMNESIVKSECEVLTVAVRRIKSDDSKHQGIMGAINWKNIWMLPNTAGCTNAEEAIRIAKLGRELAKLAGQEDNNFVKLEVIPDQKYLLPDPLGTLKAAEQLIKENFIVLPYINADPILAKRLEELGCASVMPLGSAIGSAQGILNESNIKIIIENAKVPVIVDAGIGLPSHAAKAMELGADAVLINSAIAMARNSSTMAEAMRQAVQAGRKAFIAGPLQESSEGNPSSPAYGISNFSQPMESNGK